MASFKVRRPAIFNSGIEVTGNITQTGGKITTGSMNHSSGSMTISASGVGVGSGTKVTRILHGTVGACVPAMNASTFGTGSALITKLGATDTLIMALTSTGASGIIMTDYRITAASSVSMSFYACEGNTTASTMVFSYIAFAP